MKPDIAILLKRCVVVFMCLLVASICLAGEAAETAGPNGMGGAVCPESEANGAHEAHGGADPHAAASPHAAHGDDPYAGAVHDPRVKEIASRMTCPGDCDGAVLQKCSLQHRQKHARQIAQLIEKEVPDNLIIADFARRSGMHVLDFLAGDDAKGDPVPGEITGTVLNASDENLPVADMEVEIMAYAGKSGPRKIA